MFNIDLPEGTKVRFLGFKDQESTQEFPYLPVGTIMTRKHSLGDDAELVAFQHDLGPEYAEGFDFFYEGEVEVV